MRVIGARYGSVIGVFGTKYFDETVPAKFLKRWHAAPNAVIEAGAPLRFVSRTETVDKPFITGRIQDGAPDRRQRRDRHGHSGAAFGRRSRRSDAEAGAREMDDDVADLRRIAPYRDLVRVGEDDAACDGIAGRNRPPPPSPCRRA